MAKKVLIGLDTSTDCCLVALGCEGELWEESCLLAPRAHQKILLSELDRLLSRRKLGVEELELIIVGQGPGSYTGLRVGFATARALSLALKIPIFTIPSFEVIAARFFPEAERVLVATDAKRNQVYLALYAWEGLIKTIVPPSVFSLREAGGFIEKHLLSARLVGDAFKAYPELAKGKKAEVENCFPTAQWLLRLGWNGFLKNGATPEEKALPLYLRLSSAEERALGSY